MKPKLSERSEAKFVPIEVYLQEYLRDPEAKPEKFQHSGMAEFDP